MSDNTRGEVKVGKRERGELYHYDFRVRTNNFGGMEGPMPYGTKPGHCEISKIHFPTSEEVSEVSERANE